VLQVDDVRRAFGGVRAVDGVSFALERGEIRALIGPNGAGKSTFFDILTGPAACRRGRVPGAARDRRAAAARDLAPGDQPHVPDHGHLRHAHRAGEVQVARLSHAGRSRALLIPAARWRSRRRAR